MSSLNKEAKNGYKRKLDDENLSPASAPAVTANPGQAHDASSRKANVDDTVTLEPEQEQDDFLRYFCAEVSVEADGNASTLSATKLTTESGAAFAVVSALDQLWDALPQRLTYAFLPGRFSGNKIQRTKFGKFASEWERYANVVFEQTSDIEDALIRVSFNPNDGSWSYVGNDCARAEKMDSNGNYLPTLNLGEIDGTQTTYTKRERATVLHECGHVLGLLHEHQTPALGGASVKNLDKVYHYYEERGWSRERTKKQVIDVINQASVSNFSKVDPHSIMHYPSSKLLTGLPYDVPYNTELSDMDKAYIVINYPRSSPHPDAPEWTLAHALDVAGVPEDVKEEILDLARINRDSETGEIDPQEIRNTFTTYTKKVRTRELQQQQAASQPAFPNPTTASAPTSAPSVPRTRAAYADPEGAAQATQSAPAPPRLRPAFDAPVEPAFAPPTPDTQQPFIERLYSELNDKFGPKGGTQYLCLQFPTRYLDKRAYAYTTNGIYSQFNKPPVVNEAEFRLTDELFPVGRIVGGPNGKSLSTSYELVLNNLVPKASDKEARKNRETLRQWLLKPTDEANAHYVANTVLKQDGLDEGLLQREASSGASRGIQVVSGSLGADANALLSKSSGGNDEAATSGKAKASSSLALKSVHEKGLGLPRLMTRMEFSESLTQAYLTDKAKYENLREDLIQKAREANDPKELEKITRVLTHVDAAERAKLSSRYSDSVVRGYSHIVRECLGLIDVKSTAEMLQDAKDSFRESALSSLFSASKVWPVAMQPVDWFEALDTSFSPEDLAGKYDLISEVIQTKSRHLDDLRNQLDLLTFAPQNIEAIQGQIDQATRDRDAAQSALTKSYTANTLEAVKMYLAAPTSAGTWKEKLNPGDAIVNKVKQGMDEVAKHQQSLNENNRVLTQAMAAKARAQAQETTKEKQFIERQINTVEKELGELRVQFAASVKRANAEAASAAEPSLEQIKPPPKQGGSRWIDIAFSSEVEDRQSKSASSASASSSSWECNLWIGSASSQRSESSAQQSASSSSSKVRISIAMRCTLVTVDRSGWFNPAFFDSSRAFAKNNKDLTWSTLYKSGDTAESVIKTIATGSPEEKGSALPAFPVGYILVKDTQIKVSTSSSEASSFKENFSKSKSSSGGILCFSYSESESSSSESSASSSKQASDGICVNIPGPQILGYIMQLMPKDETKLFTENTEDEIYLPPEPVQIKGGRGQAGSGAQFAAPEMPISSKDESNANETAGAVEIGSDESDEETWKDPTPGLRPSLGADPAEPANNTAAARPKTRPTANGTHRPEKGFAAPVFDEIKPAVENGTGDENIGDLIKHLLSDTDKISSLLDAEPSKKAAFLSALRNLK